MSSPSTPPNPFGQFLLRIEKQLLNYGTTLSEIGTRKEHDLAKWGLARRYHIALDMWVFMTLDEAAEFDSMRKPPKSE